MALGDFILGELSTAPIGARLYNVAAGTPIYAGDPVQQALGNTTGNVVVPAVTNTPVVGTSYFVGIAATTSTNTSSAAGTVFVTPLDPKLTYLGNPDASTSWDTQTEYDALVGARVLIKNSAASGAGTYTVLASDSANNGCVVLALDIAKTPGKVAFALRAGAYALA